MFKEHFEYFHKHDYERFNFQRKLNLIINFSNNKFNYIVEFIMGKLIEKVR